MAKIGSPEQDAFNAISAQVVAEVARPFTKKTENRRASRPAQLSVIVPKPKIDQPPPEPHEEEPASGDATSDVALEHTVRFKLFEHEKQDVRHAVRRLAELLGTEVNFSNVSRCLWQLYMNNENEILDRFRRSRSSLKRPANNDLHALTAFEEAITKTIQAAIVGAAQRRSME